MLMIMADCCSRRVCVFLSLLQSTKIFVDNLAGPQLQRTVYGRRPGFKVGVEFRSEFGFIDPRPTVGTRGSVD